MGRGFRLRDATAGDQPFLLEMLVEAVNWTGDRRVDRETVMSRPDLFHYVADWPADGEIGAEAEAEDHAIGACWLRYFTVDDPGLRICSEDAPELSLAVAAGWLGQSVGRLLLRKTADVAARAGIYPDLPKCDEHNRAHHLYASEGPGGGTQS